MPERLSIIVPVLNEEARISAHLATLVRLSGVDEIIVIDGGSVDWTRELAAAAGCRVMTAPRGRGTQMNAGADAASGDILLFVHADVTLPADAPSLIRTALADPGVVAGAFRTRTIAEGRRTWATRWLGLADLRSRYTRLPYGDQALFVRREAFQRVGDSPRSCSSRTWRSVGDCGPSAVCRRCAPTSASLDAGFSPGLCTLPSS